MNQNNKKSINQLFISLLLIGLWLFSIIQLIPIGIDQYIRESHYEVPVIRVIANSNNNSDVLVKEDLANALFSKGQLPDITDDIAVYSKEAALIPPKWVNGKFYPQAVYHANIVQIGEGRGDNWFCALFYKACGYKHKKEIKRENKFKLSTLF